MTVTVTGTAILLALTPVSAQAAETWEQATLPFTNISNPLGVAIDAAGNTTVVNGTDRGNDRILRLSPDGVETALPFTWLGGPVEVTVEGDSTYIRGTSQLPGLAIDTAGNTTVVVNCGSGSGCENPIGYKVVRLSPAGTQTTLPFTDIGGPLTQPWDVAVDAAGNTTVVDGVANRVVRLSQEGTQSTLPFAGLKGPNDVAVDATGRTNVTDSDNNRVIRLNLDGTQTILPFTGLNGPTGVAVDAAGNTTVSDRKNTRVVRLSATTPPPTPKPIFGSSDS